MRALARASVFHTSGSVMYLATQAIKIKSIPAIPSVHTSTSYPRKVSLHPTPLAWCLSLGAVLDCLVVLPKDSLVCLSLPRPLPKSHS